MVDDFPERRQLGAGRGAEETSPRARRPGGLHVDPQLAVDLPESGPFGEANQITIVEVEARVRGPRLQPGVEQPDLGRNTGDRPGVVAEEPAGFGLQFADRLDQNGPAARLEHTVELAQRRVLVRDVDEHGPGGDHIHGGVINPGQGVGGCPAEVAATEQPLGGDRLPAAIEQVLGDVGEDHPAGRPHVFEGTEGDQPIAGADVQNRLAGLEPGPVQQVVAQRVEERGQPAFPGRLGSSPWRTRSSQGCQRSGLPGGADGVEDGADGVEDGADGAGGGPGGLADGRDGLADVVTCGGRL